MLLTHMSYDGGYSTRGPANVYDNWHKIVIFGNADAWL